MKIITFILISLISFNGYPSEVKCSTNSNGNMTCVVREDSNTVKSNDQFTVKKPDFLRRQKVIDGNNKTIAVCKENFFGNLKCRSN